MRHGNGGLWNGSAQGNQHQKQRRTDLLASNGWGSISSQKRQLSCEQVQWLSRGSALLTTDDRSKGASDWVTHSPPTCRKTVVMRWRAAKSCPSAAVARR